MQSKWDDSAYLLWSVGWILKWKIPTIVDFCVVVFSTSFKYCGCFKNKVYSIADIRFEYVLHMMFFVLQMDFIYLYFYPICVFIHPC